jgi:hypothetical protein
MVSLAHGTNDAQKTMGVITLALIANGTLAAKSNAPFWVILSCALAISSVIQWLRAGYPEGVPDVDYVPLFALLGSQLSESDVKAIAEELEHMSKPESAEAIRKAIAMVTDHQASDADVARVRIPPGRGRLALGQARALQPGELALTRQAPIAVRSSRPRPGPPAGPRPARPPLQRSSVLGPDELVEPRHRLAPGHRYDVRPRETPGHREPIQGLTA